MRRWLTIAVRWLLALAPALLIGIYARMPAAAFLPYVAFVPWLLLYADDRHRRVSFVYYAVGAYVAWLAEFYQLFRFGWTSATGMGIVLFLPTLLLAPLLRRLHHRLRWPRTWSFALVWTSVEFLRATFTLSHIDFWGLGHSQARFGFLVQIADVTGAYGVSFLVAAVNGLLADAWFRLRDGGLRLGSLVAWPPLRRSAVALAGLFLLVSLYGWARLATVRDTPGPRLAIVQPNVHHTLNNVFGVFLTQVALSDRSIEPGAADLIVWPENAILDDIDRPDAYLEELARLAETKQAPILLGALGDSPGKLGRTTNTAILVDREAREIGRYDKQVLFPWSEYVPFDAWTQRYAPPLHRLHRAIVRAGWGYVPFGDRGDRMVLFELPWEGGVVPFAVFICVENTYAPVPAEAGRMGARLFVNITSEGEVGGPIQEQLLRICLMRAVENRVPYVRVGNTGISGFIDVRGRMQSVLVGERGGTVGDAGVLIDRVGLGSGRPTLYARSRDAFAIACVLLTVALLFRREREADRHGASV